MTEREPDRLAAEVRGCGPRVVAVHGFTQTNRCWGALAGALASRYELVAVDAPGHGRSGGVRADVPRAAALLGATGGRATYLGYSMGGRVALQLAVERPELVQRLVLLSASPGIADPLERARRRRHDEALARDLEQDGVEAFLTRWLAGPLFANLPAEAAHLAERLGNTVAGLASSLRDGGTGSQAPLWDRLGGLSMPVLVVAGARDPKFAGIAERMARALPRAELELVPDAGHSVHLEQPEATATRVLRWLASTPEA